MVTHDITASPYTSVFARRRPRHRWEDSIEIGFKEIGWDGVDWFNVAQHSHTWWAGVEMVMNHWVL
jgi:hypothetical protein